VTASVQPVRRYGSSHVPPSARKTGLVAADDLESTIEPSPGHSAVSNSASETLNWPPEQPFDEQISGEGHSADDKACAGSAPAPWSIELDELHAGNREMATMGAIL
jgi:hypothetical protein